LQGDTFGALCFDDPAELESMEDRIHRYLRSLAPHPSHRPALSYLSGQSTLIPTASTNLDVMLQRAEAHLAMNRGQELAPALG